MIESVKQSVRRLDSAGHPLLSPILLLIYFIWALKQKVDGIFRSVRTAWTKVTLQDIHQACNYTKVDRYPQIFQYCQRLLEGHHNLNLLSFGCSTGEEAFTLRKYFPDARITGVDINPSNIRSCIRKNQDPDIRFETIHNATFESPTIFDAMFCMAVFQRTENRHELVQDSSQIYPFMKFDQQVKALDQHLAVGGLLIVHICNYRFSDCLVAFNYEVVETPFQVSQNVPLFDEDNRKLANATSPYIIFRKSR